MVFEKQIILSSGEILDLPERLYEVLSSEKINNLTSINIDQIDEIIDVISNLPESRQLDGLDLAYQVMLFLQREKLNSDIFIFFLGIYVDKKARTLSEQGAQEEAVEILFDVMGLEKIAFSCIKPVFARRLADLMILHSEYTIEICSSFGSIQVIAAHVRELSLALDVAATFWESDTSSFAYKVNSELQKLPLVFAENSLLQEFQNIYNVFLQLRKSIPKKNIRKKSIHLEVLASLIDVLLDMVQQELLLNANIRYTSDGLNIEVIQHQTETLIRRVEKRLRRVISKKYQQQFAKSWIQHIESKFNPMYERWLRYKKKDQSAFGIYDDYSPQILEYALIEDLKDLIVAQWHLFREIFDFGYQDRNKAVFYDKVTQIINVRNALAHHRTPPDNELLRTRVLCTDILLSLDRAGEIDE